MFQIKDTENQDLLPDFFSKSLPVKTGSSLFTQEEENLLLQSPVEILQRLNSGQQLFPEISHFHCANRLLSISVNETQLLNDANSFYNINFGHSNSIIRQHQSFQQILKEENTQVNSTEITQMPFLESQRGSEDSYIFYDSKQKCLSQKEIYSISQQILKEKTWKKTPKRFQKFMKSYNIHNFDSFLKDLSQQFYIFHQKFFKETLKSKSDCQEDFRVGQKRSRHCQDFDYYLQKSQLFMKDIEQVIAQLTEIKDEIIEFRKIYKKELEQAQIEKLEGLKAEIVEALAKNRNKITARQSRINQKLERQEFGKMTENHDEIIQKIRQTYELKLYNLPDQRNYILQNLDSLIRQFNNQINSLQ